MPVIHRRELLIGGLTLPLWSLPIVAHAKTSSPPASFETLLRPTVHTGQEQWALQARMQHHRVPGVAVAILRGGRIHSIKGFGSTTAETRSPIGEDTLFSVGSVSKVVTAALCVKLAALGIVDLDKDVGSWLRRWQIPQGPDGDTSKISLRMLLSHTAGFNVHGFKDFDPGAALPTLVQTLTGTSPAVNKPLQRIDSAGTRARYSGGGYMIAQAVIEDAVGKPLNAIATEHLLGPLGMRRSRFDAGLAADTRDVAHAHDDSGAPVALPRGWQSFPELAASGFWTSAKELSRLVIALGSSYRSSDGFLPQALAIDMMTEVAPGIHGLGPRLAGQGQSRIFHHAGANDSYKAYLEGNLESGDGLIVLTNGENGDLLHNEIRNAVSDAQHWPGDWSVQVSTVDFTALLKDYTGRYVRRPNQEPLLTGVLDMSFLGEEVVISQNSEGLVLEGKSRPRSLKPLNSNRFVADAAIPAGTLQFQFDRGSDRRVVTLRVMAGDGVMVFAPE